MRARIFLAAVLILELFVVPAMADTAMANTACSPDRFEIWQTFYSKDATSHYVFNAVGNVTSASGALAGAQITWSENGFVGPVKAYAIATGTFTLTDGRVIPFQLGTKAQPYVWWFTGPTTFYIQGAFYVNGAYCQFYRANGAGTLADSTYLTMG